MHHAGEVTQIHIICTLVIDWVRMQSVQGNTVCELNE